MNEEIATRYDQILSDIKVYGDIGNFNLEYYNTNLTDLINIRRLGYIEWKSQLRKEIIGIKLTEEGKKLLFNGGFIKKSQKDLQEKLDREYLEEERIRQTYEREYLMKERTFQEENRISQKKFNRWTLSISILALCASIFQIFGEKIVLFIKVVFK